MISRRPKPELRELRNVSFTTIMIVTKDRNGEEYFGTGFFYHVYYMESGEGSSYVPILVTNKHVVEDSVKGWLVFHLTQDGISPSGKVHKIEIDNFETLFIEHYDDNVDLCAMDLQDCLDRVKDETGQRAFYQAFNHSNLPLDEELKEFFPIEGVYMIGYPLGFWDSVNNLPFIRTGTTAIPVYVDYEGECRGVLDIATFRGSSGSPVIMYRSNFKTTDGSESTFVLLGIIEMFGYFTAEGNVIRKPIPAKTKPVSEVEIMCHLGYYIKARALSELENEFTKLLES
jgi:hypothetical protein